jgi:hypothetical protein
VIKFVSKLSAGRGNSPGPLVSSTNKNDCHNRTEILLKVALNTIKQTNNHFLKKHAALFEYSIANNWYGYIYIVELVQFDT